MRINVAIISRVALAAFFAVPAAASWTDVPPTDFTMQDPPAPGSPADVADFNELFRLQATRDAKDCAVAQTQKAPDFHSFFDASGLLSAGELAAVGPFLVDRVAPVIFDVSGYFKKKFSRPRPYNEDPRIEPCADKPKGATAYPSSHATAGVVDSCVLAELFPDRAEKLRAYGKYIGDLRAIAGVHHPTDVVAGQDLGGQICKRLQADKDFRNELTRVRMNLPQN